jgi:hypothetical protein
MGCDIHVITEVKENDKWRRDDYTPFDWRSYSLFGFLADVRNYDRCEPLTKLRGFPEDSSTSVTDDDLWDTHSHSYVILKELLDFDYAKTFWNRRITRGNDGAALAEKGEGEIISYQNNLGSSFFEDLDKLRELGEPEDVRILFCFDS